MAGTCSARCAVSPIRGATRCTTVYDGRLSTWALTTSWLVDVRQGPECFVLRTLVPKRMTQHPPLTETLMEVRSHCLSGLLSGGRAREVRNRTPPLAAARNFPKSRLRTMKQRPLGRAVFGDDAELGVFGSLFAFLVRFMQIAPLRFGRRQEASLLGIAFAREGRKTLLFDKTFGVRS